PLTRTLADPVFGGSIPEVGSNLVYHVEFGGDRTRDFSVIVFDYPALQRADAHITYPAYTGLPEKRIEETRRVSAVEGSQLDFALLLNKPVASARLVAKDKSVVSLEVETNKPLAALKEFRLSTSGTYELQLVDSEGRTNRVPAQFVFEALKNRSPELKLLAPRGDQRLSSLEEITFSAEAWDDFGLRDYGLTYTVAGHKPVTLSLGSPAGANEKRALGYLLKLEDLQAQPDQLVSWFLWADDIGPDGEVRRTSSDMFFAETRPFEEIFREAQSEDGQNPNESGAGNETLKLAELEKQIINATWKLERTETDNTPSTQYRKDAPVVLQSQEKALDQAKNLEERLTDPRFQPLMENVVKEMEMAVGHLTQATNATEPLPSALASEQAAYQALLKLSAREYLISRSRGQQNNSGSQRNQQQLDQLELKQKEDRYETQRQASPQQTTEQREQLQILNRLKELAQRQQDLNERIKELQTALQEARTDQEREDIRRRLKRLREEELEMLADIDEMRQRMERPENQSRMAEARQQLEKTRTEVQQTAEALEKEAASPALASGTRAQRDLQQLRDDFRKKNSSQFAEEMRQMRSDARQLAEKQEEIGKQVESLADNKQKTLTDSGQSKETAEQLQQQRSSLTNLLDQIRGVSDKAEAVEPLLAKQLYDTLRKNAQGQADNSLNMSSELLKRSFASEAGQFEQKARGEINELKAGVEKAAESVLGDDLESLRLAKRELDALSQQIENEIAQAQGRPSQSQTNASTGLASPSENEPGRSPGAAPGEPSDQHGAQPGSPAGQQQAGDQQQPGEGQ
ncbi:MAG TPA: hypothetical protein VEO53_08150, partial [Candidatus Binatia bacterium]|nr:hypothetical protein [Candidatus Binatia bacterium]